MRKHVVILLGLFFIAAAPYKKDGYRKVKNTSFTRGEHLTYYAHYGFITAAEGEVIMDENISSINGRPCYKVDVYGKTTKFFDVIAKVRNHWGTYIDTTSIIPQKFYRYIDEGSYKRNEIMEYDHEHDSLFVHTLDLETRELKRIDPYAVKDNIQDVLSGFYYLRTVDFSKLSVGELISIDGFYKNKAFDFKVRYEGKDIIKTKLGKIKALKIAPVMPKNSVFDGENSIHLWLSDDENKIPLRVKTEMFIGSIKLDILTAEGLKNPLNKV